MYHPIQKSVACDKGVGERKQRSSTAPAVCAQEVLWQRFNALRAGRLLETSASLLSIDERLDSAPVHLDFRSPRYPPRC
eukprot:6190359-Pleurochrysis_carterae.AAC.1